MGNDCERHGSIRELIYTSKATRPFSTEDLVTLLDVAREKNTQTDITGMLVHSDGVFLQILEGPADELDHLMATIRADERHAALRVVSDREVDQRSFGTWRMAFRDAPREHLAAIDASLARSDGFADIESSLARRLLDTFLVLHD